MMTSNTAVSSSQRDALCCLLLYFLFAGFISWFHGETTMLEMHSDTMLAKEPVPAVPENIESLPLASWLLFIDKIDTSELLFSTFQAESPTNEKHKRADLRVPVSRISKIITGKLKKNETFYMAMRRHKIQGRLRSMIIKGLSEVVDFRKVHAGDKFTCRFDKYGALLEAEYEKSPFEVYAFIPADGKMKSMAFRKPVLMERRVNRMAGYIGKSLEKSLLSAGADRAIARSFMNIFSSRIDFKKDVSQGDDFEIVFEEYFRNDKKTGSGRILAASYRSNLSSRKFQAFYFKEDENRPGRYFDEHGRSMEPDLLRTPLISYRLTSKFTSRRFHPVLKKYFPHYGVDLAAPSGTPVMATADGKVRFSGWKRGFGRTVILEHKNGIKTYYGHLSRFAKGIRRGKRVVQKQIIGYVGRSGVATGPHLDYRISINGRFKDPFKIKTAATEHLSGNAYTKFTKNIKMLDMLLNDKISGQLITETIELDKNRSLPNG